VFCSSWVFSFTGEAIDVEAIGRLCRDRGVLFVLNGSQAIGTRPLDVKTTPVDALVSCGFKWLCGPYATGFCWLRRELADRLDYEQAYWLTHMADSDLSRDTEPRLRDDLGAARYDVFCTANFLNFAPWRASIELLLDYGIERVATHNQGLIERLITGLEETDWQLVSPREEPARSTLLLIGHPDPERVPAAFAALAHAGVDIAHRAGSLRISPHVFNSAADVDRALDVLA
jgi:selenocysteine lyase/cysteine desulfurase